MTNPYIGRSPYSTFTGSNFSMYRRSSYASVAAGRSTALFNPDHTDTTDPAQHHLTRQQSRGMDTEGYAPGIGSRGGFGAEIWGQGEDMGAMEVMDGARQFTPSYLKHSRYAQRLEQAHIKRMQALRDSRNTHHLPSGHGSLSTSSSSVNLHKMSSSHGNRAPLHDVVERTPIADTTDGLKGLPTRMNENDKWPGLETLADGTEVRFQGVTKTPDEAAAIRSDCPMLKEVGIYYYEVTILSRGKEGLIGVGFSGSKASLSRLPGWEADSWGYHGDDGFSFACTGGGKPYGPRFAAMDVIGCGVNFRTGTAFFTKNGIFLGDAFSNIKSDKLFPTVGIKKLGEHLRVNFGQTPFVFDIDSMMEREKSLVSSEIDKAVSGSILPTLDETSMIQELVAQYLAHEGYVETGHSFITEVQDQRQSLHTTNAVAKTMEPLDDINAINRQKIRAAILIGDIDKALKYIAAYYPRLFEPEENQDIYFRLRCRKFIEMIRQYTEQENPAMSSNSGKDQDHNGHVANDGVGIQRGDYDSDVFDHQMELDDQLQRESRGNPVQSGIKSGKSHMTDTMDTAPEVLKSAPPSPTATKSSTMIQHNLLDAAVEYGIELQTEFAHDPRKEVKKALNDTFALIAYTNARDSVVGDLIEGKGRVEIAEQVNGAILVSLGKPRSALLENLCAQTGALIDLMAESGAAPAFVNVQNDYLQ